MNVKELPHSVVRVDKGNSEQWWLLRSDSYGLGSNRNMQPNKTAENLWRGSRRWQYARSIRN